MAELANCVQRSLRSGDRDEEREQGRDRDRDRDRASKSTLAERPGCEATPSMAGSISESEDTSHPGGASLMTACCGAPGLNNDGDLVEKLIGCGALQDSSTEQLLEMITNGMDRKSTKC